MISKLMYQPYTYKSRLLKGDENAVMFLRSYKMYYDVNVTCMYDKTVASYSNFNNGYVFKIVSDKSSIKFDNGFNFNDYPSALQYYWRAILDSPFTDHSGSLTSNDFVGFYNPTNASIYLGNYYTWSSGKTFKVSVCTTITRIYYNGTDNYIDINENNKDNFFFIALEETDQYIGSTSALDYIDGLHPHDFIKPTTDSSARYYYDFKATITNHFNESANCEYRSSANMLTPMVVRLYTAPGYKYTIYGNKDLDTIYLNKSPENSSFSDKVFLNTSNLFIDDKYSEFSKYFGQPTFELDGKTYNSVKVKQEGFCTYIPFAVNIENYKDVNKINCTKVYESNNLLKLAYKTDFNSLNIIENLSITFKADDNILKNVSYNISNSEQIIELNATGIQDIFVYTTTTIKSNANQFYKYYFDYCYKVIRIKHFIESIANYIKMHYNSFTIAGGTAEPGSIYLGKFKYVTDYLFDRKDYNIYGSVVKVYYSTQKPFIHIYVPKSIYLNSAFLQYWVETVNQNCIYDTDIYKLNAWSTDYVYFILVGRYTEHTTDNEYPFDYFTVE